MAGMASEIFLEIGECSDDKSGKWGKLYLGGDNDSNLDLLAKSKSSKTTQLFKVSNYQHNLARRGAMGGSMDSFSKPEISSVNMTIDASTVDLDELINAFFGQNSQSNLVNFHLHCFREYHPNKGKDQARHHWWTLSGWEGYIQNLAESGGPSGDIISFSLTADRWRWTDWDGPKGEGMAEMIRSHTEPVKRGTPMG